MTLSRTDVEMLRARVAGVAPVPVKKRKRVGTGDLAVKKAWICEMMREPGIFIPVRTYTKGNNRQHWRVDWSRGEQQKKATERALAGVVLPPFPVKVKFIRYGPRLLDAFGNLHSSFKHIMDALAKAYGVDDRDPRWKFAEPEQVKTKRGLYGVRLILEAL